MKQLIVQTIDMTWRVLVVGIGYTLALILSGVVLGMMGLLAADTNTEAAPVFMWMFLGSLVMGLMLGLVARRLPASAARHVLIWTVLLFANISAVIIEGYFFVPDLVSNVWVTVAQ